MTVSDLLKSLSKGGFILHHDMENRNHIEIGHRSNDRGADEIFVETDEIDAIKQLGTS
jgi:hypothetical protein